MLTIPCPRLQNRNFISDLLFYFKFKALFTTCYYSSNLKLNFQIVINIWTQSFISNLLISFRFKAMFPIRHYNLDSKFFFDLLSLFKFETSSLAWYCFPFQVAIKTQVRSIFPELLPQFKFEALFSSYYYNSNSKFYFRFLIHQIQTGSCSSDFKFQFSWNKKSKRKCWVHFLLRIQLEVLSPTFCLNLKFYFRRLSWVKQNLELEFQ